MLILAGLGNPGKKYQGNRHNVGFMAVDRIHKIHGFPPWRRNFEADVSEGTISGVRVLLFKPQTYMNESGRAIGAALRFYKLSASDVIILHDELDLPAGKLRVKEGGGHGGHNGLKSITAAIGEHYRRIRLGIGHPGDKALVHGHVLSDFSKADAGWLEPLLDALAQAITEAVTGDLAGFANKVALLLAPSKQGSPHTDKKTNPSPRPQEQREEEHNSMAAILRRLIAARKEK